MHDVKEYSKRRIFVYVATMLHHSCTAGNPNALNKHLWVSYQANNDKQNMHDNQTNA